MGTPITGAKIVIFDQYLIPALITAGPSHHQHFDGGELVMAVS